MLGISCVDVRLVASQEGLSSMQLVMWWMTEEMEEANFC
jgi:hypothetical protein